MSADEYPPPPVPARPSAAAIRRALPKCRAYDLWEPATQAVPGEARGKRRIHQKPDRWHVSACLPWLEAEVRLVEPDALVVLGAVAGQGLLGSGLRVTRDRGKPMPSDLAKLVTVTTHPSAILRTRGAPERARAMDAFVADLRAVAEWLSAH